MVNFSEFSLNTGVKVGYVPNSADEYTTDPQNAVPNFIHLNFPAELLWKFHRSNNLGIGASYSKIFVGTREYGNREKSNYDRILGEISYSHILSWSDDNETTIWIKGSFTPVLKDNHADDVQNIPFRLSFVYNF